MRQRTRLRGGFLRVNAGYGQQRQSSITCQSCRLPGHFRDTLWKQKGEVEVMTVIVLRASRLNHFNLPAPSEQTS